jgi:hypothetical protein
MKKILYIVIIAVLAASCKDQDDIYKDYRVPNGTTYPGKPGSPECRPGDGRAEISWLRGNDPSITYARIYWNNYTDSVQVAVPEDADTIRFLIAPLAEGNYSFNIRTFNSDGEASVSAEVIGKVYGAAYRALLFNRIARTILFAPEINTLNIEWVGQAANEVECMLEYVNTQDAVVQLNIPLDAPATVIDDFKRGLSISSSFMPPSAIDTFRIEPSMPKVAMPVLHHQVNSGINTTASISRTTLTVYDAYVKLVAAGNAANDDPSVMTLGLEEALNLALYYKVYFNIEYQTDRAINNAQLFYGRPNAAGGVSTAENLVFEHTGLDPDDESKWVTFTFDCSDAINTHNWGATTHRMRYDFVNGNNGSSLGTTVYVRKVWFDVYTLQEVDL